MIKAYEIGVEILVKSNASAFLKTATDEFAKFDRVIQDSTKLVVDFSNSFAKMAAAGKQITKVADALKGIDKVNFNNVIGELGKTVAAGDKIATSAVNSAKEWDKSATNIEAAQAKVQAALAKTAAMAPRPPAGSGGTTGVGNTGAGRTASGGHTPDMMMTGMMAGMAGGGMLEAFKPAMELQAQLAKMPLVGFTPEQLKRAQAKALEIQQMNIGVSQVQALEQMTQTNAVFKNPDEAIEAEATFAAQGALLTVFGHGDLHSQTLAAARAGELGGYLTNKEGEFDLPKFKEFMAGLTAVNLQYEGLVGPKDWAQFMQQGGGAAANVDENALMTKYPSVMLAMKAARLGTASISLDQVEFGHMSKAYADEQARLGLIRPGGIHEIGKGVVHVDPSHFVGVEDLKHDVPKYVQETLLPQMRAHGITNLTDQINELYMLFQRSTITRMIEDIMRNKGPMERGGHAVEEMWHPTLKDADGKEIMGPDGKPQRGHMDLLGTAQDYAARNPMVQMQNLTNALDGFFIALTGPAGGTIIAFLKGMTDSLNALGNVALKYPDASGWIARTFGALSVGLVGLGATLGAVGLASAAGGGLLGLIKAPLKALGLIGGAAPVVAPGAAGASTATTAAGAGLFGLFTAIMSGAAVGGLGAMWGAHKLGFGDNLDAGIDGLQAAATPEGRAAFANNWANGGRDAFLRGLNPFASDPHHDGAHGGIPPDVAAGLARMAAPPPPAPPQPISTTVNLAVDGKVIATVVADYIAKMMGSANNGPSHFDASGTPVTPANVGH